MCSNMADLNSQENVGRIGELISGFKIPIECRSKLQENQTYENKSASVSIQLISWDLKDN